MGISGSIVSIANAVIPIIAATLYGFYGTSLYLGLALLPIFCLLMCKAQFQGSRSQNKPDGAENDTHKRILFPKGPYCVFSFDIRLRIPELHSQASPQG